MLEIVVVDNGSTDGSIEMVRTGFPSVTVVENADNVGFAAAVNQADAVATAPDRLMLNSETVVPPGVISGCRDDVRWMRRSPVWVVDSSTRTALIRAVSSGFRAFSGCSST